MFRAYIKPYNKRIQIDDLRDTVVVGSDGGGFTNTSITMVLDPPQSSSTSWVGRYIVFQDGVFANLGAQVVSEQLNGSSQIAQVTFDRILLPGNVPSPGMTFYAVYIDGNVSISGNDNFMLDKELSNISFTTDIATGFGTCNITLNEHGNVLGRYFSYLPGMYVEIQDTSGYRCWGGLIVSTSIDGLGGSITAIGPRETYKWFSAGDYVVGDNAVTLDIIKDLTIANPYLIDDAIHGYDKSYPLGGVLTEKPMRTGQNALGTKAAGPRLYIDGQYTAEEVLQDMLELGAYGMDGRYEYAKLVFQVWHDLIPTTKPILRSPVYSDVDWVIPSSAFENRFAGMTIESDLVNTEGMVAAAYQDINGNDNITPIIANINIIRQYGHREKHYTTKDNNQGSAYNSVHAAAKDKSMLGGPGSIKIRGYVKPRFGNACIPVYHIKAGDIVMIEDNIGYSSLTKNMFVNPGIFVVGSTSFDASSMTMTLTANENPAYREIFVNQIEE